jgi:hypothetical protein
MPCASLDAVSMRDLVDLQLSIERVVAEYDNLELLDEVLVQRAVDHRHGHIAVQPLKTVDAREGTRQADVRLVQVELPTKTVSMRGSRSSRTREAAHAFRPHSHRHRSSIAYLGREIGKLDQFRIEQRDRLDPGQDDVLG